jgi:hypothetical protein
MDGRTPRVPDAERCVNPETRVIRPFSRSLGFISRKSSSVGAVSTLSIEMVGLQGTNSSAPLEPAANGRRAVAITRP